MNTELLIFLDTQAAHLTPEDIVALTGRLPALRERFHGVVSQESPDLANQMEFLAEIVEDCAAGVNCEVPDACRREAAFALLYLERENNILPDDGHRAARGRRPPGGRRQAGRAAAPTHPPNFSPHGVDLSAVEPLFRQFARRR